MNNRQIFIASSVAIIAAIAVWTYFWVDAAFFYILVLPFIYMGIVDMIQVRQSIKRNFPLFGRLRYVFEDLRPKIQHYFVETATDVPPTTRNKRPLIYHQ